jgi:hypothetical protein
VPCYQATDTVLMASWLLSFMQEYEALHDDLQALAFTGLKAIDYCFRELYSWGIWLPQQPAERVSKAGICFVQHYSKCAQICHRRKINRYMQFPKQHATHHAFYEMWCQQKKFGFAYNPMNESVPMNEDLVGHVSRKSRRVDQRAVSLRTAQSYRISLRQAWNQPFQYGKE